MAQVDTGPLITLNVGGQFFTTNKETLAKERFSKLGLIAHGQMPTVQDASGVFFIDRDPKYLQLILNWLRDGWCALPAQPEAKAELLAEVRYYGLRSMEVWINSQATPVGSPAGKLALPSSCTPPSKPHVADPHLFKRMPSPDAVSTYSPTFLAGAKLSSAGALMGRLPGSPAANLDTSTALMCQNKVDNLRAAFLQATSPPPQPCVAPVHSLALTAATDDNKWTAKYLRTNEMVRQVVNTLLELAYMAPHPALNVGKVAINISAGPCTHDRISSLVGGSTAQLRSKIQHVTVKGLSTGWSCEFPIHPESDITLFNKYNIAQLVQDNWFVLTAVLKDQFGVVLEEQGVCGRTDAYDATRDQQLSCSPGHRQRGACLSCRQHTLAVTLHKIV